MNKLPKSKEIAQELNQELLNEDVVKAFQHYEALIKKHQELAESEAHIKLLQEELLQAKVHNDENYENIHKKYQEAYEAFTNHPLVVNYLNLKEEVNDLLLEVEAIINNGLAIDIDL